MKAVWVALLVVLLLLAYYGMWRGWQNRARRQSDLPEPQWVDEGCVGAGSVSVAGTYVSTTTAGQWLDRITAYGLGSLSPATLVPQADGLLVVRTPLAFLIPASDLLGVRRERGIAGKVRERDGLVVVTWRLGEYELDTGFRPDHQSQGAQIEQLVHDLMDGAAHA